MRKAASMLELVIAIVVMGIAVSALPLILTQSQNSNALALQQEAIMATKAKISYILAYEWDANSYDENASVSRVLNTNSSSDASIAFNAVDESNTRRKGHVLADKRRRMYDIGHPKRNTNFGNHGWSDIDDFNGKDENMSISAIDDYIFQINLHSDVSYFDDGEMDTIDYDSNETTFVFDSNRTKNNPTNIKMITVQTTGENGINITMRAYASNIGESGILSKVNW